MSQESLYETSEKCKAYIYLSKYTVKHVVSFLEIRLTLIFDNRHELKVNIIMAANCVLFGHQRIDKNAQALDAHSLERNYAVELRIALAHFARQ